MIKLSGQIGFTLNFEIEVEMTEDQWHSLKESEQMEMICDHLDRDDYNNMEADGIDVWDLEELDKDSESTELHSEAEAESGQGGSSDE